MFTPIWTGIKRECGSADQIPRATGPTVPDRVKSDQAEAEMSSPSQSDSPNRPRRTWRQWFKLTWVRVGLVSMIICLVSTVILAWPRRGIVLLTLLGGQAFDPSATDISIFGYPAFSRAFNVMPSWGLTVVSLQGTDAGVASVCLTNVNRTFFSHRVLNRFPHVGTFVLSGATLTSDFKNWKAPQNVRQVWFEELKQEDNIGHLSGMQGIDIINFSVCPSSGGGFENLKQIPNVSGLFFDVPPSGDAFRGICMAPSVTSLILQGGIAKDEDLVLLEQAISLEEYRSYGANNGGAAALKSLSRLTSLQTLLLNPTTASDDDLQVLSSLTSLKDLYIRGPNLTKRGIEQLRSQLPNCRIDGP